MRTASCTHLGATSRSGSDALGELALRRRPGARGRPRPIGAGGRGDRAVAAVGRLIKGTINRNTSSSLNTRRSGHAVNLSTGFRACLFAADAAGPAHPPRPVRPARRPPAGRQSARARGGTGRRLDNDERTGVSYCSARLDGAEESPDAKCAVVLSTFAVRQAVRCRVGLKAIREKAILARSEEPRAGIATKDCNRHNWRPVGARGTALAHSAGAELWPEQWNLTTGPVPSLRQTRRPARRQSRRQMPCPASPNTARHSRSSQLDTAVN